MRLNYTNIIKVNNQQLKVTIKTIISYLYFKFEFNFKFTITMKNYKILFLIKFFVLLLLSISCGSEDVNPLPVDASIEPLTPNPSTLNLENVMLNSE